MNESEERNWYNEYLASISAAEEVDAAIRRTYERYGIKPLEREEPEYKEPNWKDFNIYIESILNSESHKDVKDIYSNFYNKTLKNVSYIVRQKIMYYLDKIASQSHYGYFDINNENKIKTFIYNLETLLKNNTRSTIIVDIAYMSAMKNICYYSENNLLSKIINSKLLIESNLVDSFLTGLLNSPLFKDSFSYVLTYIESVLNESSFYYNGLNLEIANYYLMCPTIKHCKVIKLLINKSTSSFESEFVLDFLDEIINTDENELDNLIFHIKNRTVKKEVTFAEACKKYNEQAMEILKNSTEVITPETIVTVIDYESEFPEFPMPDFTLPSYPIMEEDPVKKYKNRIF